MHVRIANLRLRGTRSWHSPRMCNPQFYVPGKRPMGKTMARSFAYTIYHYYCVCYISGWHERSNTRKWSELWLYSTPQFRTAITAAVHSYMVLNRLIEYGLCIAKQLRFNVMTYFFSDDVFWNLRLGFLWINVEAHVLMVMRTDTGLPECILIPTVYMNNLHTCMYM